MTNGTEGTSGVLVTVGEIASMAGVGPSAVSNWRNRHSDFPVPVEQTPAGDLFDRDAVISWLQQAGKKVKAPTPDWVERVWRVADSLRGEMSLDDAVLLVLQILYVHSRGSRDGGETGSQWRDVRTDEGLRLDHWRAFLGQATLDPEQERALLPPSGARAYHLQQAWHALGATSPPPNGWGPVATVLLDRYQQSRGAGGTAWTPPGVTALHVELLKPIIGAVYDPACGAAMVLAESWRLRENDDLLLHGQEVNEFNWRLGYLHLALNSARFELRTGDTLRDDRFRSLRAQRVAVDPPFGTKQRVGELQGDERWVLGMPRGTTDWLWPQVAAFHLADDGIAVVSLPQGALSRRADEGARRALLESGLLDAVIELPPGLFAGTSAQSALLVLARERGRRAGHVLFVDAKQLGQPRRGKLHELEEDDVERITRAVARWRSGSFEEEPRFAALAAVEAVANNEADLSPKRYVRYSTRVSEIEGEPIPERLQRLRSRAAHLAPETASIVAEAVENLNLPTVDAGAPVSSARLGDLLLAEPQTGSRQVEDGKGREVPFITTGLVTGGSGHLKALPGTLTRGKTRGRLAERGDVLLASRGIDSQSRVGCAIVAFEGKSAYSESLLRLSPDPSRLDPGYLRLFLTSYQGRNALVAATTGSVIANLRADAVKEIALPLPAIQTQREIVQALDRVEQASGALDELLGSLRDAFDAAREGVLAGLQAPE